MNEQMNMMTLEKIKKLVRGGESEFVEFKTTTSSLSDIFGTVCAFLNGEGGTILIEVGNTGKIVGQDVTDNTRKELASHMAKLEPWAQEYTHVNYIPVGNGKKVIAISVSSGKHVPYAYDGRHLYVHNQPPAE